MGPPTKKVHLVLAGGGVRSLSFAGTLDVLAASNIEFGSVSTCSAGTFVGALLCCGLKPEDIVARIFNLPSWAVLAGTRASFIPDFAYGLVPGLLFLHPMLRWPFARYRESGFSNAFKAIVGGDPTFRELELPLAIAAFDITAQRYLVYASDTHPAMTVSEALSIAVSIPFAYRPKLRKGRMIMDAGVASECPVWLAADRSYDPIIALRPKRDLPTPRPESMSLAQFYTETMGSVIRGLDDYIILKMPRVRLIEIDCGSIEGHHFDVTDTEKKQLIECGRNAARAALNQCGEGLTLPHQQETERSFYNQHDNDDTRYDSLALRHGTELMRRFHQNMSKDMPTRVFISYAREDSDLAEYVVDKLNKFLERRDAIWFDKRIEPGEEWEVIIKEKMWESRVALLLVSPDFLSSDYIAKVEIPELEDLQTKKRMTVIPVIMRACEWHGVGYINQMQLPWSDEPFDCLTEERRKKELAKLADKIERELLA